MSLQAASSALDRIKKEENCKTVLLYHSLPDEVDTHRLIDLVSQLGYKVLLPTVVGNDLELHEYTGTAALRASAAYGIQESTGELFADYASIDLAIIPGMAFTEDGKRLGRGKGYYDRLLPLLPDAYKIGLCFKFQIVGSIPADSHDVGMDEVLSTP